LRKFLSAAFGGGADGIIIALGGSGAVSVATKQPVELQAIYYLVLVNVLLDTARFVKSNPDPWEFPVPAVMPVVIPQTNAEASGFPKPPSGT
jgi:hypothetical protein